MSMAPFMGIPGKLKTLAGRLTAARASNLDNLDQTVSSRAPASSALSSATWTNTRAGRIDTNIASRASQASVNTIDSEVGTLLARVPTTVTNAALSKSAVVEWVGTGASNGALISLGSVFDRARTSVDVGFPYQVGSSPVGEPQAVWPRWGWASTSSIYIIFHDSSGTQQTISTNKRVQIVAMEFAE